MKSLSISAQKEAPFLSSGETTYRCSCTSHLARGAALGARALVLDTWGTMVVRSYPCYCPVPW